MIRAVCQNPIHHMPPNREPFEILEVSETNFESEVLRSQVPTLVAFGAGWSKPCQVLNSVVQDLVRHCAGKVRVLRVNVDDNPDLGIWFGIESIPTLLCFVEGQVRLRIVGTVSTDAVLAKLDQLGILTKDQAVTKSKSDEKT
jgi:thioredoxin 1